MLNNINGRGLSKTKKVDVLKFPGATSADIVTKIDDVLDEKPESIIIHVGTNDLTNDINLLSNLHLNRKGNSIFAKNVLNCINGN